MDEIQNASISLGIRVAAQIFFGTQLNSILDQLIKLKSDESLSILKAFNFDEGIFFLNNFSL